MKARKNIGSVTMPAGDYFVGDPCYAVPDAQWIPWLEAARYDEQPSPRYLLAEVDGRPVLGIGTAHGDGSYEGSDGFSYPVDAGLIGAVPVEIAEVESDTDSGMTRVTFERDFTCSYEEDEGVITIGDIEIVTDPPAYEESIW